MSPTNKEMDEMLKLTAALNKKGYHLPTFFRMWKSSRMKQWKPKTIKVDVENNIIHLTRKQYEANLLYIITDGISNERCNYIGKVLSIDSGYPIAWYNSDIINVNIYKYETQLFAEYTSDRIINRLIKKDYNQIRSICSNISSFPRDTVGSIINCFSKKCVQLMIDGKHQLGYFATMIKIILLKNYDNVRSLYELVELVSTIISMNADAKLEFDSSVPHFSYRLFGAWEKISSKELKKMIKDLDSFSRYLRCMVVR